jgi:Ca2+-binding EF-hand superfamily protein
MKTIPVSLIVAGILAPVAAFAEAPGGPQGPGQRGGEGRRGNERPFTDAWKAADTDQDGSVSRAEFDRMPRIQGLPEEKRTGLFKRLDKNGDGLLNRSEISHIVRHREGQDPPRLRLWELDTDKSGGVSFEEFQAGRIFKKLAPEKQQAVFRRLDTNGDGVISPKDRPESRFKRDGEKGRPKRPDGNMPDGPRQIIRQLDTDKDGALSFEEFRVGPAVRHLSEDEQEDRFEALDRNHDLKITAKDFAPPGPGNERKRPKNPPSPGE